MMSTGRTFVTLPVTLIGLAIALRGVAAQQQLGHKLLGGIGINAGVQAEPGLYLLDRFVSYNAGTIKDREGESLPVKGLDIDARGNVLGFALTLKPKRAPYLTAAAGLPLAKISVNSDQPLASIDRSGLGDLFVQPIKVGWRKDRYDIVSAYTFYAPTGKFEPREVGVGRGFWTHQLSLGGAMYRGAERNPRASALVSYDMNSRKRNIDIKRGNTLQVQGGAGVLVSRVFLVGVAGFALWQVTDDRGRDIPQSLRGLRTRVYGIGPEVGIIIRPARLLAEFRYEHELGARSRPQGSVFVAGLSYAAWQPRRPPADTGRVR